MANTPFDLAPYLDARQRRVESLLEVRLSALRVDTPTRLYDAMAYSLAVGGKRLRPILCLAFTDAVRKSSAEHRASEDAACALELIHTYSLVHDDLPVMDDDDLRRGRPTNHKVFGEAFAILAGDALLTEAFGLVARGPEPFRAQLCAELASGAGAAGMVGGQAMDVAEDRPPSDRDYLVKLHRLKTGRLIRAACRMGVVAAEGGAQALAAADAYGDAVGLAFQIADDVLDVTSSAELMGKPTGADAAKGRPTFPALWGLEAARALAEEQVGVALERARILEPEPGPLAALARYAVERYS